MITRPVRQRMHQSSSSHQSTSKDWILRLTLLAMCAALLWINRGFIKPIAMAGLFAATLAPLGSWLSRRNIQWMKNSTARAAVMTLGFAITFILPIGIVAFLAADAGLKRVQGLPQDWTGQLQLDNIIALVEKYLPFEHSDIVRVLEQGATAVGRSLLLMLQGLVSDLPKLTIDNVVIVLTLFVFLRESERIMTWLRRFSPLTEPKTEVFFRAVGSLAGSVVLATIASGIVQSMIIGMVCLFLGIPNTLLITMTSFVLSFIPVIGTAPVSLWLIGVAALDGNWTRVVVFLITAGVVGVSDNFVRPYVLSGTARIHPLVGFIAAIGALESIGFYGLFLGPVIAGAVFTLVELVLNKEGSHSLS